MTRISRTNLSRESLDESSGVSQRHPASLVALGLNSHRSPFAPENTNNSKMVGIKLQLYKYPSTVYEHSYSVYIYI